MRTMGDAAFDRRAGEVATSVQQRLEQAQEFDDAARLELLDDLYREFEQELDRDLGEGPSSRR